MTKGRFLRAALSAASLLAVLAAAGCGSAAVRPAAAAPSPPSWEADNPVRPLPVPPLGSPADFASVPWVTPEKVRLGRWLFYDARLSADGTVSCATCHEPEHGYSEDRPTSTGIRGQVGKRKAPPVLNAAWPIYPVFFWDGRAGSLQEQAKGPMENPIEMGNSHQGVLRTLAGVEGYRPYFRQAFGDDRLDIDRVAEAIAAYEATRLSGDSAYDRFDAGDERALTPLARQGRDLFFGRARCSACHLGPNFTDSRFHDVGVGWRPPPPGRPPADGYRDPGRFAVTRDPRDLGAFKTPTLRDVTRHPPYMHDGSMRTLREVMEHYQRRGDASPNLAPDVALARFTPGEIPALIAFLEALDGTGFADTPPRIFPR